MAFDFDIAVYAVNEAKTIESCIRSIDLACAGKRGHITVLLNGTTDNTVSIIKSIRLSNTIIDVYYIPVADKSNAINKYLYDLRLEGVSVYFGVDAYTTVGPSALQAMGNAFEAAPKALMASGVPINGRSASAQSSKTLRGGTVNGQLYAMRPSFVDRLVGSGLRLPVELYSGDGLLGSMAAHDLNALENLWDDKRIIGVPGATFEIPALSMFSWSDIKRQYKREARQVRGRIQNEAIKKIIYEFGFEALPDNANDIALDWLKENRWGPKNLRQRFFLQKALKQIHNTNNRLHSASPMLVFSR